MIVIVYVNHPAASGADVWPFHPVFGAGRGPGVYCRQKTLPELLKTSNGSTGRWNTGTTMVLNPRLSIDFILETDLLDRLLCVV